MPAQSVHRFRRSLLVTVAALIPIGALAGCGSTGGDNGTSVSEAAVSAPVASDTGGSAAAATDAASSDAVGSAAAGSDSAGASAPAATGPVTVKTADGDLEVPAPVQKIAVMQWQFLDMLLSMGVQPTMIADEQTAGSANPIPPQFKGKLGKYQSLGGRLAPSLEVLASEPLDLILVDKGEHLKDKAQFDTFAATGVFDTWGWDAFYPNLQALGALTGHPDKAAQVQAALEAHFADASKKLSGRAGSKVMVAVATNDKFFPFTGNSMEAGVMKDLGFGYAYKDVPGSLTEQIPLEALAAAAPDVLFLAADPGAAMVTDTWKGNALWESIPAVKNHQVFRVDRGVWSTGRGPMAVDLMIDTTLDLLKA